MLLAIMIASLVPSLSVQTIWAQSSYDWSGDWEQSDGYIMRIDSEGANYYDVWIGGDEEFLGRQYGGTASGSVLTVTLLQYPMPQGTITSYRLVMSPDGNSITAYGVPWGSTQENVIFTATRTSGSSLDLTAIAVGVLAVAGGGMAVYVLKAKRAKVNVKSPPPQILPTGTPPPPPPYTIPPTQKAPPAPGVQQKPPEVDFKAPPTTRMRGREDAYIPYGGPWQQSPPAPGTLPPLQHPEVPESIMRAHRALQLAQTYPGMPVLDYSTMFAPGLNNVRDLQEVLTGRDLFEGKKLSWFEWGTSLIGLGAELIPGGQFVSGAGIRHILGKGIKMAGKLADFLQKGMKLIQDGQKILPDGVSTELNANLREDYRERARARAQGRYY